jgi:hypothetical protein
MGNRKAPTPRPANQIKPDPPPAPPRKVTATVTIERASCAMYHTDRREVRCPLCDQLVPPRVHHECEKDGGIKTVRNAPANDIDIADMLTRAVSGSRSRKG